MLLKLETMIVNAREKKYKYNIKNVKSTFRA